MSEGKSDRELLPPPQPSAMDRVLDRIEIVLWLALLVVGIAVAWTVLREPGAPVGPREAGPPPTDLVEAETLTVVARSRDFLVVEQPTQGFPGGEWSGGSHLFASGTQDGDWMELALPTLEPGRYTVEAYLTRAADYGVILVSVDGAGVEVDLWSQQGVTPTGAVEVGTFTLGGDGHLLRIEVSGTHPRSSPPHFQFGIDGVRLTRQ